MRDDIHMYKSYSNEKEEHDHIPEKNNVQNQTTIQPYRLKIFCFYFQINLTQILMADDMY